MFIFFHNEKKFTKSLHQYKLAHRYCEWHSSANGLLSVAGLCFSLVLPSRIFCDEENVFCTNRYGSPKLDRATKYLNIHMTVLKRKQLLLNCAVTHYTLAAWACYRDGGALVGRQWLVTRIPFLSRSAAD